MTYSENIFFILIRKVCKNVCHTKNHLTHMSYIVYAADNALDLLNWLQKLVDLMINTHFNFERHSCVKQKVVRQICGIGNRYKRVVNFFTFCAIELNKNDFFSKDS